MRSSRPSSASRWRLRPSSRPRRSLVAAGLRVGRHAGSDRRGRDRERRLGPGPRRRRTGRRRGVPRHRQRRRARPTRSSPRRAPAAGMRRDPRDDDRHERHDRDAPDRAARRPGGRAPSRSQPGGYHLMIMGLKAPLAAGDDGRARPRLRARRQGRRPGRGPAGLTWRGSRGRRAAVRPRRPSQRRSAGRPARGGLRGCSSSSRSVAGLRSGRARRPARPAAASTARRDPGRPSTSRRSSYPAVATPRRSRSIDPDARAVHAGLAARRPRARLLRLHPLPGRLPGDDRDGRHRDARRSARACGPSS